jgi:hypothetical protein
MSAILPRFRARRPPLDVPMSLGPADSEPGGEPGQGEQRADDVPASRSRLRAIFACHSDALGPVNRS